MAMRSLAPTELTKRMAAELLVARTLAGYTQAAAAAEVGIHQRTLSLIENGKTGPYLDTVLALLDLYGMELAVIPKEQESATEGGVEL